METTGKLTAVTRDIITGKLNITFQINGGSLEDLNNLAALESLTIKADKEKRKRSLDANAYFHVLVGKIADVQRISKPYAKNLLLGRYGQRETDEFGKPLVVSILTEIDMMQREDIHLYPIGHGSVQGKEFTHYAVIRGSHTYDSKEMTILIDGTVDEAKDMGVETLPEEEIRHMEELWRARKAY